MTEINTKFIFSLVPSFSDVRDMADIFNRICWGLYGKDKFLVTYQQPSGLELKEDLSSFPIPNSQVPFLTHSNVKYFRRVGSHENRASELNRVSQILIWKNILLEDPEFKLRLEKSILIDPYHWLNYEADQIASLQFSMLDSAEKTSLREESIRNYIQLLHRFSENQRVCLFLTGPSLPHIVTDIQLAQSVKIICNSMVKDQRMMRFIQPDILMFSDPAYHFGVSLYAEEFRHQVINALDQFPSLVCIVPESYLPLTQAYFRQYSSDRFIGIPLKESDTFNIPGIQNFYTRKTGNILTQLMIPIAVRLSKQVDIYGADGRQSLDKGYWQHAPSAQLEGLLETINASHPSLGRDEDIGLYYKEHCDSLGELLDYGESLGFTFRTCTHSNIPALKKRETWIIP